MRYLLLCLATALLCGCATFGHDFDLDAVNTLQPGVSTIADARAILGPQQVETLTADGRHIYTWSFSHANALGAATAKTASLVFDRDGKLIARSTGTSK